MYTSRVHAAERFNTTLSRHATASNVLLLTGVLLSALGIEYAIPLDSECCETIATTCLLQLGCLRLNAAFVYKMDTKLKL